MDFLDKTGHIFSLQSYSDYPIGYEFQETPYIFWFKGEKSYKLSVDCWYFQSIRLLIPININEKVSTKISLESDKFYLLGSKDIQEKLLSDEFKEINDRITLYSNTFKKELNYNSTILFDENNTLSIKENGDLLGCVVEKSNTKIYTKYNFTYNNGTNIYNGIPIKKDNKFYGELKIGVLKKEIELDSELKESIKYFTNEEVFDNKIRSGFYIENDETKYFESEINTISDYYLIIPFYVLTKSDEIGAWETNILINNVFNDDEENSSEFCPITIGANFVDENEPLIINGKNMGVNLPKEILKAVYSGNYFSDTVDEHLYSEKLKEYLLNYMSIKGEIGNYKSALNSLKWFEWGDLLSINKLWKRDVDIQNQYIKDYFDIVNDTIYSYQLFQNTTLISLSFKLNKETFDENKNLIKEKQDFNNFFAGEGKPVLVKNTSKLKDIRYDEEDIPFYRGYYDYTFTELGLKLCALKYYYEKYFLPIHIKIHSASLSHQVWMNDIKFFARTNNYITEVPVYNGYYNSLIKYEDIDSFTDKDIKVIFNYPNAINNDIIFINHIIDNLDIEKDANQIYLNYKNYISKYPDTSYEEYISNKENLKDFYYFDSDYNCFSNSKEIALNGYINTKEYINIDISIENDSISISENIDSIISVDENKIIINNITDKNIKYTLNGNFDNYYFSITSNKEIYLILDSCTFNTNKNIISIENNINSYIELKGTSVLGTNENRIKKGISSKGDIIFFGNGNLNIYSYDNSISSSKEIRIYSGNFNLNTKYISESKNCISTNSIIIYDGNINCTCNGGCEYNSSKDDYKVSCCIKGDSDFSIYNGTLNLIAINDGDKCINFSGNAFFYGGTINAETKGNVKYFQKIDGSIDKKSPKVVKIEGNVIVDGDSYIRIKTSLSKEIPERVFNLPLDVLREGKEGFECEGNLTIYSGKIISIAFDDAINVRGILKSYGGLLLGCSIYNDAIDINDNSYLLGGTIIGITESLFSGDYGIDTEFEPELGNKKLFIGIDENDNRVEKYGTLFDSYCRTTNRFKYELYNDLYIYENHSKINVYYVFISEQFNFIYRTQKSNINNQNIIKDFYFNSSYNSGVYVLTENEFNSLPNGCITKVFDYEELNTNSTIEYINHIKDIDFYIINDISSIENIVKNRTDYSELDAFGDDLGFNKIESSSNINYIIPSPREISYEYKDNLDKLNYVTTEEEIENNTIDSYYIDDTALFIPINIVCPSGQYLDVHLELFKEDNSIHSSNFKFIQSDNKRYKGIVIYPKLIYKDFNIKDWENKKFKLTLLINGNYFEYNFIAKLPEINIGVGKLEYEYDNKFSQIESINTDKVKFNTYMHTPSLVTVNNLDWPEEIVAFYNKMQEYVNKYYSSKINTINKYLNYCYLIDIFDKDGNYIKVERNDELENEYTDIWDYVNNTSIHYIDIVNNIELYNDFFESNENGNVEIKDSIIENISDVLSISEIKENYDFYLMHDLDRYYLICISKYTSENISNPLIPKATFKSDKYNFRFLKADKKLLINRFKFIESDGVNHFNEDDIIAFYLKCNDKLKFKITSGTKWKINQISAKNSISLSIESLAEMAIVSLQNDKAVLDKGYYNINVFYSIDDYSQNSKEAFGKFRVD